MSTHIFLLLDMSGSMADNKQASIDACNEFIESQRSNLALYDTVFSLAVFNSNVGLERIVREVPIDRAPLIDHEHYMPGGVTPLYDSIGEGMDLLSSHEGKVLFIIQTDGYENSSRRVSREDVVERVAAKTKEGWQFVYLGCDIDAMEHGGDIGIAAGNTLSYDRDDSAQAFRRLSTSVSMYRTSGSQASESFMLDPDEDPVDGSDQTSQGASGSNR